MELLDEEFALMVKNPGIPYSNPMIEKALAKGIPVLTEVRIGLLDFRCANCRDYGFKRKDYDYNYDWRSSDYCGAKWTLIR